MLTKTDIEKYFLAEKSESLLFLVIGIAAILLGIAFFFFLKSHGYKGAAIPLLAIGLIQAAAGYAVYTRSDSQRINNVYAYDMNPDKLRTEELPRMKAVNGRFMIYCRIEILLAVAGIALIVWFRNNTGKTFWLGLGFTLAVQAAIMLFADYFAARRASVYTTQLETFAAGKLNG